MFTGERMNAARATGSKKKTCQLTNEMINEIDSFTLKRRSLLHRQGQVDPKLSPSWSKLSS